MHFIIDTETTGMDVTSPFPIFQAAYTKFDFQRFVENPYTYEELESMIQTRKYDVRDQIDNLGLNVQSSTIDWWKTQDKEVRDRVAKPKTTDLKVSTLIPEISDYVGNTKITNWWTRGNTFDPIVLLFIAKACNQQPILQSALPWWAVRDTRTYIDAVSGFKIRHDFMPEGVPENVRKHDAAVDTAIDVLRLQAAYRFISCD